MIVLYVRKISISSPKIDIFKYRDKSIRRMGNFYGDESIFFSYVNNRFTSLQRPQRIFSILDNRIEKAINIIKLDEWLNNVKLRRERI